MKCRFSFGSSGRISEPGPYIEAIAVSRSVDRCQSEPRDIVPATEDPRPVAHACCDRPRVTSQLAVRALASACSQVYLKFNLRISAEPLQCARTKTFPVNPATLRLTTTVRRCFQDKSSGTTWGIVMR